MKIEAAIKNVDKVVVKMTIEMTMSEWMSARDGLGPYGAHGELANKIVSLYTDLEKVLEPKEAPTPQ